MERERSKSSAGPPAPARNRLLVTCASNRWRRSAQAGGRSGYRIAIMQRSRNSPTRQQRRTVGTTTLPTTTACVLQQGAPLGHASAQSEDTLRQLWIHARRWGLLIYSPRALDGTRIGEWRAPSHSARCHWAAALVVQQAHLARCHWVAALVVQQASSHWEVTAAQQAPCCWEVSAAPITRCRCH